MALSGLDSALSGLRVAQQQMNVISTNISNVSTPGYTRKLLPQSAVSADGVTIGVRGDAIVRSVDLNLTRDFWTQVSSTNFFEVQASFLNQIQQFHGPPDAELSIAAKLANLRDSFLALSNTPDDVFLLQNVVSESVNVANKFNEFSTLLSQMRNDAQDLIEDAVERVNNLLIQVADINKQIKINTSVGKTTAALEDIRDNAIKDISEELEISFFIRGDGVMVVQTSDGVQLADENAETLFFDGTPLGPTSHYFSPGDPNNSAAGLFVGGDPVTDPTAFDITNRSPNGTIGGLLDLRDNILPEHMAQLDELAHKLAYRFEAQGIRLFTDESGRVPLNSYANVIGNTDLVALGGGGALSTAGGGTYTAGLDDVFTITIDPNGVAPQTLTISLSTAEANFPPPSPQSLVDEINAQAALLPTPLNEITASIDASNQLTISSKYDILIDASNAGEMGSDGLNTLGLTAGITNNNPKNTPFEPIPYIGFASEIKVNNLVIDDNALLRESTLGLNVQDGSNEFIRRVTDYVFGQNEFQLAAGQIVDDITHPFGISVSNDANPAADTLQEAFGFSSFARIVSSVDIASLAAGGPLSTAPGNPFLPSSGPPLTDAFTITFDPSGGSGGPQALTIDLSTAEANFPALSGDQALVSEINAQVAGLPVPFNSAVASINALGQLVLDAQFDINIDASIVGGMGEDGLSYLGLNAGTTVALEPFFQVQIGQDDPVTVSIAPGDTEIDLLAKLNAIPGVEATIGTGPNPPGLDNLFIRPGTGFGGDLKLIAGDIRSNTGSTILNELFGVPDPVIDFSNLEFNELNLGPGANITGRVQGASDLISFSQKLISAQSETANITNARLEDEITFRDVLSRQLLDESGVNLEEELSNLIVIQTAFAAAARTVQAIDELFQDLLNSV